MRESRFVALNGTDLQRPARLLMVGAGYPPHGPVGGYELSWQSFADHARAAGVDCHVLTTRTTAPIAAEEGVTRALRAFQAEDGRWINPSLAGRASLEWADMQALRRELGRMRPDAVMFWVMSGLPVSLIDTAARAGCAVVPWVCDLWPQYGLRTDPWNRMGRRLGSAARLSRRVPHFPALTVDFDATVDRWLFASDYVRREVTAHLGLSRGNREVVPSPVADQFFAAPSACERRWGGRLLTYGRLMHDKGIDVAVKAVAQCPEGTTLDVVGPPGDVDVRAIAGELNLGERIRVHGQVPRHELPAWLSGADALVFPVRWEEPLGLVPLEAMASGVPVVMTARGGGAEYARDGQNCLVAPAGDEAAVATAVARLASDADLRRRLIDGGRKTAERFRSDICNGRALHLTLSARSRS